MGIGHVVTVYLRILITLNLLFGQGVCDLIAVFILIKLIPGPLSVGHGLCILINLFYLAVITVRYGSCKSDFHGLGPYAVLVIIVIPGLGTADIHRAGNCVCKVITGLLCNITGYSLFAYAVGIFIAFSIVFGKLCKYVLISRPNRFLIFYGFNT